MAGSRGRIATIPDPLAPPSHASMLQSSNSARELSCNCATARLRRESAHVYSVGETKRGFPCHASRSAAPLFAGAASLFALAAATPALAQNMPPSAVTPEDDEQNIVVTATLREQNLLDVPFSINAQTEEDIQRSGATTLEDLSRNVAGLAIQNLGPGQSQVSVRGVSAGQIVRDQPGVKEQVGVYLDDSVISLSLFTPDLDLFDLNRLETLRGPQGTLFGSGSVGGTLRYITNQPDSDGFEARSKAISTWSMATRLAATSRA